jgi:GrpB-like predicted nucleotidyltransferase (UPF0157 family)
VLEDLRRELLALVNDAVPDPQLRARMMRRFDLALARRLTPPRVVDRFARLLDRHGWPTVELAGDDGELAAFELAMLCAADDAVLGRRAHKLLAEAAALRLAPTTHDAVLADRVRVLEGERQLHGTQYDWGDDGELRPLPIADLQGLESIRRLVGLPQLGDDTRRERLSAGDFDERAPLDLEAHREAQRQRATAAGWREVEEMDEPADLSAYDARWPAFFFDEARHIAELLGTAAVVIEHVGSTAVPGMYAKPIVDIVVGVVEPLEPEQRDTLELGGYEPYGQPGHFRLRGDKNFDLHVVESGSRDLSDAVALRDFLRAHPAVARGYSEHKRRILAGGARTNTAYNERKTPFLVNLLDRARSWAALR